MTQNLTDQELYQLFKTQRPPALPPRLAQDPMDAAEQAEAGGDLAFLNAPVSPGPVPARVLERARRLGAPQPHRSRIGIAALVTFVTFGFGSYALASSLIGGSEDDPFAAEDLGLFETAEASGLIGETVNEGGDF